MVGGMPARPKTLARVLLVAFGVLCFFVLSYLTREVVGDFISGWITEEIGARTGVGEPQVRAFIAAWLLPAASIVLAMWFAAVVTRWRVKAEHAERDVLSRPSPSVGVFPAGRTNASGASMALPAASFVVTFHNVTAAPVHLFRAGPDGVTDAPLLFEPRSALGALTREGDQWVAKDMIGGELRRHAATIGADRLVRIGDF